MAKEVIDKVLEMEATCEKNLLDARKKAEKIIEDAEINSKNHYDQTIKMTKEKIASKLDDANEQAKKAIENAINDATLEKDKTIEKIKSKQEKAIQEIIDSLI